MRYMIIDPRNSLSTKPRTVVIVTPGEWNKMEWKLTEPRVKAEALNAMKEKELIKKENSRQMTKNWANTVEQIQLQREQKLKDAARKEEEEKIRINEEIMQRKEKEREEAFERAKRIVYENKDTSRAVLSGVMLSSVIEERLKQIELKKRLQRKKAETEAVEAAKIWKSAADYKEELMRNKLEDLKKKKRNGEILKEQVTEIKHSRQRLQEELLREREDNVHTSNEIKEIEEQEKKDAVKKKKKLKDEEEIQKKILRDRREQIKQEELDQSKINAIYQDAKAKLDKQRKETEAQIRREEQERRARTAEKCQVVLHEKEEEESRLKAVEAQELKYQEEQKEKAARKNSLREELLMLEKEAAVEMKVQRKKDLEERRWALLQRLALDEADKKLKECEEQKRLCKQRQLREILTEQWKERHDRDIRERTDDMKIFEQARAEEREGLLKYCADAEKFTRDMKWPMYPVSAVIRSILKNEGIPEENREVPFLQSRVPIPSVEVYEKKE